MDNLTFWDIEDFLQEKGVFVSGIDGRKTHSDSYMTVVEFKVLDEVLKNNPFTLELWKKGIEDWTTNSNNQPPLKLVGRIAKRFFNIE